MKTTTTKTSRKPLPTSIVWDRLWTRYTKALREGRPVDRIRREIHRFDRANGFPLTSWV